MISVYRCTKGIRLVLELAFELELELELAFETFLFWGSSIFGGI